MRVVVVVFTIGDISYGHVNSSVTISFSIFNFPQSKIPVYIVAQITGSVLATLVESVVYGVEISLMTTRPIHGTSSAFWVEIITTFIIVLLAASVTCNYKTFGRCNDRDVETLLQVGYLSGIVIGMAIALACLSHGNVIT
ncbi:hypothetical protein SAY86_015279 [Trapa natans]|uniref:Aquaporin n=1 Tax=Trapa natans TaxID=22666 RepID=A0AAN7KHQ4_TRANT|nr:hypothetical protein SAY86_015279 [Trapa natans]